MLAEALLIGQSGAVLMGGPELRRSRSSSLVTTADGRGASTASDRRSPWHSASADLPSTTSDRRPCRDSQQSRSSTSVSRSLDSADELLRAGPRGRRIRVRRP